METQLKISPLYNVQRIDKNKQHFYQIDDDDNWLPGATGPLGMLNKPGLIPWAANTTSENIKEFLLQNPGPLTKEQIKQICEDGKNIYKKKSQAGKDAGTLVHQTIDTLIKEDKLIIPEEGLMPAVEGFVKWKQSNNLTIEMGDTKIASKVFKYGGTLDMVAFDGNEPIIFDFKTNNKKKGSNHGIYPETAYQLAAYAQAFKETFGIEVKKVFALWLNKEKPEFMAVPVINLPFAFDGFLSCLKLYNLSKLNLFDDFSLSPS